jgi:hypothetical protein
MSINDKRQFIFTLADDDVHFFMYVAGSAQENIYDCEYLEGVPRIKCFSLILFKKFILMRVR